MAVVGHVERFLDRGVAAADHRHLLAAVEEAVAGRAGRDALALQMLLARQVQPLAPGRRWRSPACRRDRRCRRRRSAGTGAAERSTSTIWSHIICAPTCSACFCICSISQGPWMTSREAGIILDVGGDGELAAGLDALDDDRREAGAGAVDGGGEPGRAGAEDEHAGGMGGGHGSARYGLGPPPAQRRICRSDEALIEAAPIPAVRRLTP